MNNENKKEDPLISVIVPIYNVEKYVRKCLESLRGQTMKEIEVICIDDGSTDGSGEIADEYAKEDQRFRVIHTENRGLSAARNRGIDESKAEWLMFVDSDDWVEPDFCRVPYEAAIENKADLVIFGAYRTTEAGRVKRNRKSVITVGLIDSETAIDIGSDFVWNKIYSKTLFNNIRYPEGHVCEDIYTTHKLIFTASKIYRSQNRLYYYRIRRGSISRSPASRIDEYLAKRQQYKELVESGYPEEKAIIRLQAASLVFCGQAASTEEELYRSATKIVQDITGIPEAFDNKQRLKLILWRINKNMYRVVYKALGKRMVD